ncbi:MAG: DegT/DnrJ/EryC1/StrS family aminotransferase, partial [Muribaculaceae bacterium]|nr:DegT/DnrJ/EryC1/StrS family aminotransferase [Muribaculaceae bacterium]
MTYPFLNLAKVNEPYAAEMVAAAECVIRSGRYIGGTEVESLERELGNYLHAPYAVGVSNGLDALRLILRSWIIMGRLQPGDKVIVAANTYVASILAITDAGLVPVLTDPDPVTLNISAKGIADVLDERTKCVMPVHLYGRVAWDKEIRQIIEDNSLLVIEDCAQAIGARSATEGMYGSYMAGARGHAGALSF